jgi:hypothetical protein
VLIRLDRKDPTELTISGRVKHVTDECLLTEQRERADKLEKENKRLLEELQNFK